MTMTATLRAATQSRSRFLVAVVFFVFFVISFLTNILGPLIPDIIADFHVSLTMAAILPFAFFIAYGVMSIPAGFAVQRWGEKKPMVASFVAATLGAASFAAFPTYSMAVTSLFVIGAGMAVLQVAINPLLRVAGGEEHFAFNSAFAQLIFGAASFVSPLVYSDLVRHLDPAHRDLTGLYAVLGSITTPALPWVSIYWIFAVVSGVCVVLITLLRLPKVERTAEESAGTLSMYRQLLRNPYVWLYFLAIIAYVGCEQGTADWMSPFLERYHHVDPHTGGAHAVAYYWGLMTAGCLLGMGLLKLFDSRRVLIGFSHRCAVHAVGGPVWPGRSIPGGLSLHRFLRLDHVAHTGVAGLELGTPAPRPFRRDPVLGDHGWRARALCDRLARRSVRPAIWNAVSVSHLRVRLERRRVGATADSQRN